jgi:hypothetical protein
MNKYTIVLEDGISKEENTVTEYGFNVEDVFDLLSIKYGTGYIVVQITDEGEVE